MANIYCGSTKYTAVTQWAAGATLAVGAIRRQLAVPSVGNERCFRVSAITTGITGGSEPAWNLNANNTTTDGGVTWTECTGQALYNGDGGGTAYGAPHARLGNAHNFSSAGDKIFVSQAHAATQAASISWHDQGNQTSPVAVICVNDSVVPATALATGASETMSANNGNYAICDYTHGNAYYYGMSFIATGSPTLFYCASYPYDTPCNVTFDNCIFNQNNTNASSYYQLALSANNNGGTKAIFKNCTFLFGHVSQYISGCGDQLFKNCTFANSGTVPSVLFGTTGQGQGSGFTRIIDSDLSAINTTLATTDGQVGLISFENCRLNASVTPTSSLSSYYPNCASVRLHNCDSSGTNYRYYLGNSLGAIQHETTRVRTGGATDGTTPLSWNMASSANAGFYQPLVSEEIAIWNAVVGSTVTLTVYLTTNATLDNSKFWIEADVLTNASYPLASINSTQAAILASGTTLTTDTSTWGGSALTNKYKIVKTFTPQLAGPIKLRFYLGVASTTVYADPLIALS